MLSAVPPRYRRPRFRPRRRRTASQAPPAVNQITSVVYGAAPEFLIVTVTGTLTGLGELQGLMSVVVGENTYTPINADMSEAPVVYLEFETDVTTATAWSVPDPVTWEFAAGALGAPFSGSIE